MSPPHPTSSAGRRQVAVKATTIRRTRNDKNTIPQNTDWGNLNRCFLFTFYLRFLKQSRQRRFPVSRGWNGNSFISPLHPLHFQSPCTILRSPCGRNDFPPPLLPRCFEWQSRQSKLLVFFGSNGSSLMPVLQLLQLQFPWNILYIATYPFSINKYSILYHTWRSAFTQSPYECALWWHNDRLLRKPCQRRMPHMPEWWKARLPYA